MVEPDSVSRPPAVTVIVPARNEELCLRDCLQSLASQTGVSFEIVLVDDGSTDGTRSIAQSFPGVKIIEPGPLPHGWVGKNHAVAAGARATRSYWLLFTDADTIHLPGSLAGSVAEAEALGVALLSYSPEQEAITFWEKVIMPVIFAELATTYRPSEVNDPASALAAANGQYMLMSRDAYEAVGGHAAVAGNLLEDVAMAKLVKASGRKIVFRMGAGVVRTRMYRSFGQLREGWTKNLAMLFPSPVRLAAIRFGEFAVIVGSAAIAITAVLAGHPAWAAAAGLAAISFYAVLLRRIRRAHFSHQANTLALAGLPLFSYLLLRSWIFYKQGKVSWKGREYNPAATSLGDENGLSHAQS